MKIKFWAVYGLFFILMSASFAQEDDYRSSNHEMNIQDYAAIQFKSGINIRTMDSNPGAIIVGNYGRNQGSISYFDPSILKRYPESVCTFQYDDHTSMLEYLRLLKDRPNFSVVVREGEYFVRYPRVAVETFDYLNKQRTKVTLQFIIDLDIREKSNPQTCMDTVTYKATCTKYPKNNAEAYFSLEDLKLTLGSPVENEIANN